MLDFIAQGSEEAGGAPTQDLVWGAAVAGALTLLALWVCFAHRTGRITWLGSMADFAARVAGLPRWAALPSAVTGGPLLAIVAAWLVALGFGLRRLLRTAGEPYPDEGLGARAGEGAERDVPRPAVGAQA